MNDQNETTQLRFLEETGIRLRQDGFTVEPIEDHHLPVCWEKGRLCRITGKGSVLYRQENVDSIRAQDALQTVIDTAKMTSEYMAILETAPLLKASGLTGDYRVLADFGSAVLAGHSTERGVQFVTWEWDFDREGVHHGHYFQDDYEAAKRDFTVRSGLVQKDALFEPEQLAEIYRALRFVREQDETLVKIIDECTSRGSVAMRIVAKTRTVDRDRLSEFVDLGEAYRRVKKFATKNQFFDLPQDEQMSAIAFILIVERGPVESSLKDCIAEDAIIRVLDQMKSKIEIEDTQRD